MATNPFDQFDTQQTGPVLGPPRLPPMQTPDQATGQALNNARTQQEIGAQPLQNENTRVNIQQGQTSVQSQQQSMRLDRVKAATGLQESFRNDPTVKAYREVMPQVAQAETAAQSGAGDNTIVYAWAKAMDPTGSVREGDVQLAQAASGPLQQAQLMVSQYHLLTGGSLPPAVRIGLIEEMRNKARELDRQYSAIRSNYINTAKANGLDPSIIGTHEGELFQSTEEAYIRSHGGTPRNNGVPVGPQAVSPEEGQFGPTKNTSPFSPEQQAAYDAFLKANPNATPDQLNSFIHSIGLAGTIQNAGDITKTLQQTGQFAPAATAVNGRAQDLANQYMQQGGGAGAALTAGAADAASLGSADELGAAGNALVGSLQGQGSFGDLYDLNSQANRLYEDQLRSEHPIATGAGEVIGSAALPTFGAQGVVGAAKLGAAYGGIYGFNSGDGGIVNRLASGAEGAAAGGALGAAIPAGTSLIFNRKAAASVPPLVDPVTGRLNEPLEQAGPAARVQAAKDFGIDLPMGSAGDRTAAIVERKLDVRPASAGVMNDARRVAEGQVQDAVENVAGKFGLSRTLNGAGSELQRGALERNDRAAGVIAKAYNAIPIADTAQTSKANTVGLLQQLTGRFQSNPKLAEAMHDPQLARYLDAFQGGEVSWQDMKDFRSIIGEKIGQMRFGESSSTSDLRALYGALSQDMRDTAAAQGPRALRSFERANTLNRQNEEVVQGALTRILGKDGQLSPEKAAQAVQAMTKGGKGTGDLKTLAQVKAATVKSGAWDEVAGAMIRIGGQPADSPGRGFDPKTFVQWYSDMAESARQMLFKPELRKSLDQFVAVNQRLANSNALRNTSNTALASPTGTFSIPTAFAALFTGHPEIAAGIVAGTAVKAGAEYKMAKIWTDPKFVQWATGYSKAVASGSGHAINSQIGRLQAIAVANPELREPLVALQQKLLSAANDNFTPAVASQPDQGSDNQPQ